MDNDKRSRREGTIDNGKRFYVIDKSPRSFMGTILECDLLENWSRVGEKAISVWDWTLHCEVGDELLDNEFNVRIIRTR